MAEPHKINPQSLSDYLDVMSKTTFQSGISWKVVDAKWPSTQEAFHGFDPEIVAGFAESELDQLTNDTRVIRNRRKLEAVVANARRMLELEREHGSFRNYLRSHGGFDQTAADLKKQFKFMGEHGTYYFMYVVGEEVPEYEEWSAARRLTPQVPKS
ncbi:MAG: DNA-3-methyladenine glycosylase I [Chloroflexi bacterium]|nr:DNA-3-methyladenine glycosylase I [Chloroflexota bacterium]